MSITARYVHTNLIARDWEKLAAFYERVFGCERMPPERDLAGEWLERATGLAGAHICGVHLRLPGYGDGGPTLEVFQYGEHTEAREPAVGHPGFAHIAFAVHNVETARDTVLAEGGSMVGEVVSMEIAGAGAITFAYARDPEGNIIELQQWAKQE